MQIPYNIIYVPRSCVKRMSEIEIRVVIQLERREILGESFDQSSLRWSWYGTHMTTPRVALRLN